MWPDARPQARKYRRRIHWNTVRIFPGRARCRWSRIVRRTRTFNVGQAPNTGLSKEPDMNDIPIFPRRWSFIFQSRCMGFCTTNGLNSETVLATIPILKLLRGTFSIPIIFSFCLSGCSADLVVHNVKDTSVFNGIRVYSLANFKVTKTTQTRNCPAQTTQAIVQLPLGEPYDVTVKNSWFAKSEFSVLFNDAGLLKQVTVNSTPQLAETLTAMAALAKSIGEATKPGVGLAQANCGTVLSEKIDKVERLTISP